MLVFEKNVTRFFRIKVFMQEGSPKKVLFPKNAIITSGRKRCKIDVFEVRYLKNDNGEPYFYYIFLLKALKSTI